MLQQNVSRSQFLGCSPGAVTIGQYDEPLFYKKGITIIQSIKVRIKHSKNVTIVSTPGIEDGQRWLDRDEYPVRLMSVFIIIDFIFLCFSCKYL